MERTLLRAAQLVDLFDSDSDTSSGSSSQCEVEGKQTAGYSSKAESPVPKQLPVMEPKQEVEIIVISSGDESSDVEAGSADEAGAKPTARGYGAKAARTTAPSVSAMRQRYDECLKAYDAWKSRQEQRRSAPAEQPAVEVDGILAEAIEEYSTLEDDDQHVGPEKQGQWVPQVLLEVEHEEAAFERMPTKRKVDQRQRDYKDATCETGIRLPVPNAHDGDKNSESDEIKAGQHPKPSVGDGRTKDVRPPSMEKELQCRRPAGLELKRSKAMMSNEPSNHARTEEQQKLPKPSQISSGNIATKTKLREKPIVIQAQTSGIRKGILKHRRSAEKTRGPRTRDKIARERISKKQLIALAPKIEFPSRQQLLDIRANLRNEKKVGHHQRSVRATDSNGAACLVFRTRLISEVQS
ncbi:hypothetical protein BST61_g954 [Cercospora zeina]